MFNLVKIAWKKKKAYDDVLYASFKTSTKMYGNFESENV